MHWTFGQKIGAGFALIVALTIAISALAVTALRGVVAGKDRVISVYGENAIDSEKLTVASARKIVAARGFLIDSEERHLQEMRERREQFRTVLQRVRARSGGDDERSLLERIERAEADQQVAAERVIALRKGTAAFDAVVRAFDEDVAPKREALVQALDAYSSRQLRLRDEAKQTATDAANSAITQVTAIAVIVVLFGSAVAFLLSRTLGRQIGTAVGQVQSSSAELQSAANQQAAGAKEQATAMNEINTTINELLATSRQIAESAQRVAGVAEQAVRAARTGDATVQKASDSIAGIQRQVELIVGHMLDLGRKSQQIGAVLDIVSELAEQTNILAINATIEAAGAGETGRRFAVVADEIRKLADRVAGSTKEIRGLIEEVRSAVNATVMQTETGSKTVDAGSRQFAEVAASFKQIADVVATTTEAAREIELSTKQQSTAVEQVNVAIANVAQATRETEASTGQTLQTASQLATLSRELLRLVQPQAAVQPAH
jgi:methyl-accepting chemotaxis protein